MAMNRLSLEHYVGSQLYVVIPVRGSKEPLLVCQGTITSQTIPAMMDRLVVPRLEMEPETLSTVGSLTQRVACLQCSQDFNRMADVIDGIVNTDGSPVFVVRPENSTQRDTKPIRLGTWLRQQQAQHQPIAKGKSPLASTHNGKTIDDLLSQACENILPEPITNYKVKARLGT